MKKWTELILLLSLIANLFLGYQYVQNSKTINEVEQTIIYAGNMTLASFQGIVQLTSRPNINWQSELFKTMFFTEILQMQRNGKAVQLLAHVKSETLSEIRYNLALLTEKLDVEIVPLARKMAEGQQSLSQKELATIKNFVEEVKKAKFENQIQTDGGSEFNEKLKKLIGKL